MIKTFLLIMSIIFPSIALGEGGNKGVIQYFLDNYFIGLIISGGYYSLGVIIILIILSAVFESFLKIVLSVLLAIFGLLLVLFAFQALDNLEWIPPLY